MEAPGSRPVHGSLTAPARIRDGTQGIANLKGGSLLTAALGGSFGAGPRQVSFSCERQHGLICPRTELLWAARLGQVSNRAGELVGMELLVCTVLHDVVAPVMRIIYARGGGGPAKARWRLANCRAQPGPLFASWSWQF